VKGGWDASFTFRDIAANVTTLHAANPLKAVITIQGTIGNADTLTPSLDGFTITGACGVTSACAAPTAWSMVGGRSKSICLPVCGDLSA
jgi:hypothetical protein